MDFVNAIILLLNYIFVPALAYGSQLALGAIFVTLIYGILRFANFATGDMMSFGTMFVILFTFYFQSVGISFGVLPTALLAIPFGIIFMVGYMLIIDKLVFKYYRINKSPPVQLAMVSIGVMFVTQAVVRIIIGPSDRRFFDGEKFLIKAGEFKEMTGLNEGLAIKSTQVITIIVTLILVSTLFWFLNKTKTGKSMRAYSDNEDSLSSADGVIILFFSLSNIRLALTVFTSNSVFFLLSLEYLSSRICTAKISEATYVSPTLRDSLSELFKTLYKLDVISVFSLRLEITGSELISSIHSTLSLSRLSLDASNNFLPRHLVSRIDNSTCALSIC